MSKFHINTHGDPAPCKARPGRCPLAQDSEHYNSYEEARSAYENSMKNSLPTPARLLHSVPLKEMDSAMLTQTLFTEAITAGLDIEELGNAVTLASLLHAKQVRGNRGKFEKTSYIEHPLRNAIRLMRMEVNDQNVIQATILHDTIEDCSEIFVEKFSVSTNDAPRKVFTNYLKNTFGQRTTDLVLGVTNEETVDKNLSREKKNEIYREHVEQQISKDGGVYLVKISDYVDNAGSIQWTTASLGVARTQNLAKKYLPLIAVFRKYINNIDTIAPPQAKTELWLHLDRIEQRLKQFATDVPSDS